MRSTFIALALFSLLASCAPRVLTASGWDITVLNTRASVKLVNATEFGFCKDRLVGCSIPMGQGCVIMLDRTYFLNGTDRQRALLLAHEFGHCLDGSKLLYSHNRFGDAGKMYGQYYASASEGFAEAYARAYIEKCGLNLAPLGWGQGETCELPDPRGVTADTLRP